MVSWGTYMREAGDTLCKQSRRCELWRLRKGLCGKEHGGLWNWKRKRATRPSERNLSCSQFGVSPVKLVWDLMKSWVPGPTGKKPGVVTCKMLNSLGWLVDHRSQGDTLSQESWGTTLEVTLGPPYTCVHMHLHACLQPFPCRAYKNESNCALSPSLWQCVIDTVEN